MAIFLSACGGPTGAAATPTFNDSGSISTPEETQQAKSTTAAIPTGQATIEQTLQEETAFGYTYHRPDGNRLITGASAIPGSAPIDVPLKGIPVWVAAAQSGNSSVWAAVLEDGEVQAFTLQGGEIRETEISPKRIAPGAPLLLKVQNGTAHILTGLDENTSPLSHPVPLDKYGEVLAYIEKNGDVVIRENGEEKDRLEVNALPDARLIVDESGRLLVLSEPTQRYDHGVLGDDLEAGSITMIETRPEARVLLTIPVEEPAVIEGIAPIWVDLNADGDREIIVTQSDAGQGARLVVYDHTGGKIAAGPSIGTGYRWRNQLGAAPFSGGRPWELVDVLTPHLTGVVEFYQLEGENLEIVSQLSGYTSHVIGTRNLDMGLMGDFDGDRIIEVLLPNQGRTELGGIKRTESGAELDWSVPVGGTVSSNLAAVTTPDGGVIVGVGRKDGFLRIWAP